MLDMVERTGRKAGQVKIEVVTVTPDIASAWLDKNTGNRKLSKRFVETFARDIASGRWMLTGESIKFSKSGTLIDGQTRLSACIAAKKSFETFVVYGLDDAAKNFVDTGRVRSAKDVLFMRGVQNPPGTAAAIKLLLSEKTGETKVQKSGLTHSELLEAIGRHPSLPLYIPYGSQIPRGISAAAVGFINYAGASILGKKARAAEMVSVMKSGVPAYDGDPIHRYRERVIKNYEGIGATIDDRVAAFQTLKFCWNAFAKKQPIERLDWKREHVPIDGLDVSKL